MNKPDRARTNEAEILRALAAIGQCRVAEALDVSETRVSRWKSEGEIAKTADMLAVLGLQVVPVTNLTVEANVLEALRVLAAKGLGATDLISKPIDQ